MLILIGAAILSLVLGLTTPDPRTGVVEYSTGWVEGAAILVSVGIVIMVTAVNDFKKQEKFAELNINTEYDKQVTVTRSGSKTSIHSSDIVVGDLLHVNPGDRCSVDCILVHGSSVVFDESDVTGERDEVGKGPGDPFLISGTSQIEGSGIGLVVAVGVTSFSGSIAIATRAKKKPTPLQEKLEDLADTIGKFGLVAATLTFIILAVKETYFLFAIEGQKFSFMKYWEMLTTAVAIVVVAVPEGLPLSVTISLAYSMQQMLEDKNLVRHLSACETMGGATCICSDKTGTLTTNDMNATKLWVAGADHDVRQSDGGIKSHITEQHLVEICKSICYSSIDEFNKTALTLVELTKRLGYFIECSDIHEEYSRLQFTSARKMSCTRISDRSQQGKHPRRATHLGSTLYTKGASEMVLEKCTSWMSSRGTVEPLSDSVRGEIERALNGYAENGLRTISMALSRSSTYDEKDFVVEGATFLALVGIEEPVRPEVRGAIEQCKEAGVKVKMVTGDNKVSAMAVATKCGIYEQGIGISMEGREFRSMSDEDRQEILSSLVVLARATPLDKKILVEALKTDPLQVVAVTGDGTNDGPALKCADVGFAMNSGTEVAKAASDIILTDDNFVGVAKAILWGRNVNSNIKKFIQFQLTVNGAACAIAVAGAFFSESNLSPLKPVQLLWLNLIMDSLAALGLATELPSPKLIKEPPLPKDAPIINRNMWGFILGHGLYQLQVCMFLLLRGHEWVGVEYFSDIHLTVVFNTFVMMQVFNFFNARILGVDLNLFVELDHSHILVIIAFVIAASQVLIINYGGIFFGVVPLPWSLWYKCLTLSSGSIPIGILIRYSLSRHRGRRCGLKRMSPMKV
eukprot:TRINITY_DN847_c5_g1_i1.p1 TRINITY_DN847_c5_g1~~TRINITY_DN847_c5_g1_i1.p1  ORF type:complete len:954 (+),score=182.21 TRINITY_DN847_c5_g1_i1:289-2862(+)